MPTKFWEGFFKEAGRASDFKSKLLYRLQRGLPVRLTGHSRKSIRKTRAGKSL